MPYLTLLISIFSLFTLMDQCNQRQDTAPPKELFNHWIHSHEEDGKDFKVYRPSSYDFPPSRGRKGFEIKEGQTFILHRIAPADGIEKVEGSWEWKAEKQQIAVSFPESTDQAGMELQVLKVGKNKLKVKE